MPLQGGGKKGIGPNVKTEESAGKPFKQALAIALDKARKTGADIPQKPAKAPKGGRR